MTRPTLAIVGHHVREAAKLSPGRPAIWLGLRTAAATAVPLVVAHWLDPTAADWAPLGGFLVALSDKGGAYRSRAKTMASVAIGGLAAVVIGSLIAGHGVATAVAVALGLTLCSLTQAFGDRLVSTGNAVAVQFLVAAALPCSLHDALERGVGFAGGAGFALFLGLVVWPVRVYKPARRAVSAVLLALARLAREAPSDEDGAVHYRVIRDNIERARAVLAATRHGRHGDTRYGEYLLARLQLSDQLFALLVGLEETLQAGVLPEARARTIEGLDELAALLEDDAARVLLDEPPPPRASTWSAVVPREGSAVERALARHALEQVARALHDRAIAAEVYEPLEPGDALLGLHVTDPEPGPSWRDALRDAVDPAGPIARHAIRVAIVVCTAMFVARELDLSHRHWVTLSAYVLLRPLPAVTRVRALQRVTGTIVGCVVAAAIPGLIDDARGVLVMVVVLAGASALVDRINYALYAMLVTPAFALLAEMHSTGANLVGVRIINTMIAAALVVIASLLWPARRLGRFDDLIAASYEAAAAYLECVVAAIVAGDPFPSRAPVAARREYGMAINRAEIALDELAREYEPTDLLEPRMTQAAFLRRLGGAITTLATTREIPEYAEHRVELAAFGASVAACLRELAAHCRDGTPLVARRCPGRVMAEPVFGACLERIDLALASATDAALRAAAETESVDQPDGPPVET